MGKIQLLFSQGTGISNPNMCLELFFPYVMMIGLDEEVRQRGTDKVQDERRLQMDAILRGEGGGGHLTLKEEVVAAGEKQHSIPFRCRNHHYP